MLDGVLVSVASRVQSWTALRKRDKWNFIAHINCRSITVEFRSFSYDVLIDSKA